LGSNDIGSANSAVGWDALTSNTSGNHNTAFGNSALSNNFTGNDNTALGHAAGSNLSTGDNNIDIGWSVVGVAGESNTTRIGNGNVTATYINGISGATVANGATVLIGSNGHLGTINSSVRFKDDIMPMDRASEAILSLKPVTFRYKKELDPGRVPQFGLVAEDVAKAPLRPGSHTIHVGGTFDEFNFTIDTTFNITVE